MLIFWLAVSNEPDSATGRLVSNFLLWQAAYAELYFTETLWPEFTIEEFDDALAVFGGRERRFGKTSEQIHQERLEN